MIQDSKVLSFVSKGDYQAYGGDFLQTYYKDSLEGQTDGWTIDNTTGIVTSRSGSNYSNYLRPPLGYLKAGDQIEFAGEFAKVGHDVIFLLEYSVNQNMSGTTWEEGITVIPGLTSSLEMKKFALNIKKDGYYRLYIGCYQTSPSEFKMRNVSIRLKSIQSLNPKIESGTWTPSIAGTTGTNIGSYTLVGKTITIKAQITLTSKGASTGSVTINGLPYTPKTGQINYGIAEVTNATLATGYSRIFANLALGYKTAYLRKTGNGLGNAFLTFDEIANNSEIYLQISYEV